jgi:hypothetical protein
MNVDTTIDKKRCLDWLVKDYKQKPVIDEEYKNYERSCATTENIDDILNLHTYFNDNNLLRAIYQQMSKDYGFCFLHGIIIEGDISNSNFYVLSGNKLVPFERDKYMSEIENCKNNIFAIPFGISKHNNMLIVNTLDKTFEHFEPHGTHYQGADGEIIGMWLETAAINLKDILFPDGSYKYIEPSRICPTIGFQKELNLRFGSSKFQGSCAIWSMWYAFLRLSSPDKRQEDVYEYAIQNTDLEHLDDFIIYLINGFVSKVNIEKDSEGKPISVNGKNIISIRDNKIVYSSGNVYEGNIVNGLPNGFGKLTYTKYNLSYEGSFVDGVFDINSIFKIYFPTGDQYEGIISPVGRPNGKGIMIYFDKHKEEGIWENGILISTGGRRKKKNYKRTKRVTAKMGVYKRRITRKHITRKHITRKRVTKKYNKY